ncbi:ligase-associated DNA damage response DEXH box helicase [Parasphingorhabdus sp. JC815]|uniref:ligase-associated DNA damage response DEXH box helicase n=1 Tax=Parasphingorhabdus sp. JC815 TaxID=3232140 RepID=UPI00345A97B1
MPTASITDNPHISSTVPLKFPVPMEKWFADQNWHIRDYQRAMVDAYNKREDTLLIAPTGGGKTLAGFLPSLIALFDKPAKSQANVKTLYISPLRALTNDIERNLARPIKDMNLPITIGVRTGDTKSSQRTKQRKTPPDFLLTTPESLMLLLSYDDAEEYFANLDVVIIDELHSFATGKRGDFTSLALARLKTLAPDHVRFGLSATISNPENAARWLGPTGSSAKVLEVKSSTRPSISVIETDARIPLGGHSPHYAIKQIYDEILSAKSAIIFVNTRAQAELLFQQLWLKNDRNLSILIYHGSLSREKREKTESFIASGAMRAVVSTSALEMGIDWGDVDKVIQVGAPKGISRLLQRIGRSNHRMDEPSRAIMVPCNPLEAVECEVAIDAIAQGHRDGEDYHGGALDVVVQYIVNRACASPVKKRELYNEIRSAHPYRNLSEGDFERLLEFAQNGGYSLKVYDRYQRLQATSLGYRIVNREQALRHRMNIGTIVEDAKIKVRRMAGPKSKRGRIIGEIEEQFVMNLVSGDTFVFAGEVLRYQGMKDRVIEAQPAPKHRAKVPAFWGGMMPLSSYLADGVRRVLADPEQWANLAPQVQSWLRLQNKFSELPKPHGVLVESFFDRGDYVTIFHTFEGRKVNNALGFLLTRRMEKADLKPLNFSITDYALTITTLEPVENVDDLLTTDVVAGELHDWIIESPMVKRSFRKIATISGLTEQRQHGTQRPMKQIMFSTDLIYDVLMKYEPDHILLRISREEAERELLDVERLTQWIRDIKGHIRFRSLPHASPLSIPSMMQLGKEKIRGKAEEELLRRASYESLGEELLTQVEKTLSA